MMVPQSMRVIQAADRSDSIPKLFQRHQRLRELVVGTRLSDLEVDRVHTVRQIDKDTAFGPFDVGGVQRLHAVQQRERQRDTNSSQHVTSIHQPALSEELSHELPLSSRLISDICVAASLPAATPVS